MPDRLLPPLWTLGALVVWVVLALRSPDLTYHFAPLIAAAAWPIASSRAITAVVSGALTVVVSIGLQLAGSLEGPDLVSGDAAFAEALVFAVVGALVGAGWAVGRRGSADREHTPIRS